jgi:CxxC motif-containing protein (DUF1111 family)
MVSRRHVCGVVFTLLCLWSVTGLFAQTPCINLSINFSNFTQTQAEEPGKLTFTYKPGLSENESGGCYTLGMDLNYINNTVSQYCNTVVMTHTDAGTYKATINANAGDDIDYFYTHHMMGRAQNFYGWIPSHKCKMEHDSKWFNYKMGTGFEKQPAWPIIVEGSERYRNRHEDEWRFDHFTGNYFQNTALNYKLVDYGDKLEVTLFPSEPTNFSDFRFFGGTGFDILCDHDGYELNFGSLAAHTVEMHPWPGDTIKNPYQVNFPKDTVNWYRMRLDGLSYGQFVDFELSAQRRLSVPPQLYYSEPQRYWIGNGRIGQRWQHPWANAADRASVNYVTYPAYSYAQHVMDTQKGNSAFFMKGKAMFDTDWKTGRVYNFSTPYDCNGSSTAFPDTTHSPFFKQGVIGPFYKQTSCFGCHFNDGKGYPETGQGSDNNFNLSTFVNLQVVDAKGQPADHPVFGPSLQIKAEAPYQPQGKCNVSWVDGPSGTYADGTPYKLRKPMYSFSNLAYGVTSMEGVRYSPRFIPHLSGMGLLDAIPEATILSFVSLSLKQGTGITGKPQRVNDYFQGPNTLGRFGWKCGLASLKSEIYACVALDLGISNSYFSNFPPPGSQSNPPEVPDAYIDTLIAYLSLLAPPPRELGKAYIIYDPLYSTGTEPDIWKDPRLYKGEAFELRWRDPSAIRGKDLFFQAKCHLCHVPAIRTGNDHKFLELRNLDIQPFTDMLLHDMGPEEADNGYVEGIAGPSEWRTSPLWGVGLLKYTNGGHTCYMHDGRARGLEEAILWHFGEGKVSRDAFLAMNAQQRQDLIRYTEYPFAERLAKGAASTFATPMGTIPAPGAYAARAFGKAGLFCYPNPARNFAVIRFVNILDPASPGNATLSIFNVKGQAVYTQKIQPRQTMVKWDAARYTSGKYVVQLSSNGATYRKELLLMK